MGEVGQITGEVEPITGEVDPNMGEVLPMVFRCSGTYISVHRRFRTLGVVPFDSARREESNGIYFESVSNRPPAKVYPDPLTGEVVPITVGLLREGSNI